MKNSAALLALLVLFSCAKARELPDDSIGQSGFNPVKQQPTDKQTTPDSEEKKVELQVRRYEGKVLTINSATDARIKLSNKDAKALYEALQIKKFEFKDEKTNDVKAKIKRGHFVLCNEDENALDCSFVINPHNGYLIDQNWANFQADRDYAVKPVPATGRNYDITANHFTVMIKGKDARELYEALNITPVESEKDGAQINTKGTAPFLTCIERLTDEAEFYICSFTLRLSDGNFPTKEELEEPAKIQVIDTKPAAPTENPDSLVPTPEVAGGSVPEVKEETVPEIKDETVKEESAPAPVNDSKPNP